MSNTWEDLFEYLIGEGYTDDEVWDDVERRLGPGGRRRVLVTRDGVGLRWGSLHDERRIRAVFAATRGVSPGWTDPSSDPGWLANLWSDPKWLAIVRFHRETGQPRPKIGTVAKAMGLGEQSIRTRLRPLGIDDWRDVHDLVAARPPGASD